MQRPRDPDPDTETKPAPELADLEACLSAAGESGRYRVVSRLGAGGMGVVYKAIDAKLNRAVAIKAILASGHIAEATVRLRREARVAASLDHPYICRVYELIETAHDRLIVMEFVEGETLAAILSRGVPPLATTLQMGIEIAEGLANAHEHGLVHRDLKPANIMVTPHGHVKLLDFGLARTDPASAPTGASQSSVPPRDEFAGTPHYMAPEQAEGQPVTMRADIFSLGVVLFQCVTGRLPFDGGNRVHYLERLRFDQPTPVQRLAPEAPDDLARLIDSCLARTPANRPESATIIVRELRRLAGASATGDRAAAARAPLTRLSWSTVPVLAVLAAAGFALWWFLARQSIDIVWQSRPVLTSSRSDSKSRLSPDKRWVSYMSASSGQERLLVKPLNGGDAQSVTLPDGEVLDHLWSPDGNQLIVALRRNENIRLHLVPAFFGGTPVQSVPFPGAEVRLLRMIGRSVFIGGTQLSERGLWRVDLDGGVATEISAGWGVDGRPLMFDVSPDGRQIAFTVSLSGQEDLWVCEAECSSPRRLTNDAAFERFPLWSGAGDTIIYQSNRGGQIDLWEISAQSGRSRALTSGRDVETPESASSDGTLLTYTLVSEEAHLWRWDPLRRSGSQLTDDVLNDSSPVTTATGSPIVFERSRPSPLAGTLTDSTLFVGFLDGQVLREPRVVDDGFAASLSPDGLWLAYLRRGADQGATLVVTELRTSDTRIVSSTIQRPAYQTFPAEWAEQSLAWSRAGSTLYFVDGRDRRTLKSYEAGTNPATHTLVTVPSGQIIRELRPSANGQALAFLVSALSMSAPASTLHLLDVTSGSDRQVLRLEGYVYARGWLSDDAEAVLVRAPPYYEDFTADVEVMAVAPGGKIRSIGTIGRAVTATARLDAARAMLYVTRSEAGIHNLFRFALGSATLSRITDNARAGITFSGIEPLADGSLIGVRSESRSDIWLMEADAGADIGPGQAGR